jgi:hypothetical protein
VPALESLCVFPRLANQFFTSNRRMADQLPGLPEASFARARHHIVFIGSVLLLNCDVVTIWFTMSGEGNVFESSIWMV